MNQPVRPIFNNGQRLTAERLTQAVEYLRTSIRRLALAPLGSGVAIGLELSADDLGRLVVSPGIAIDGRGRLLVVETEQFFSLDDIQGQAGSVPPGGAVAVRLQMVDDVNPADPCSQPGVVVVDSVGFGFQQVVIPTGLDAPGQNVGTAACVDPWIDLDRTTAACGVTLGDVVRVTSPSPSWRFSLRSRQGVSSQFGLVRSPAGNTAIVLGEMALDLGRGTVTGEAVAVVPNAEFEGDVRFRSRVRVQALDGDFVQATTVGALDQAPAAGVWFDDPSIFVAKGQRDPLLAKSDFAGVTAVQCKFDAVNGSVPRSGFPLYIMGVDQNTHVKVSTGTENTGVDLIGVSAAGVHEIVGTGELIVPVATSGLVRVRVQTSVGLIPGADLTPSSTPGVLTPAIAGQIVVAKAAQTPSLPSPFDIFAWVVHPPRPH